MHDKKYKKSMIVLLGLVLLLTTACGNIGGTPHQQDVSPNQNNNRQLGMLSANGAGQLQQNEQVSIIQSIQLGGKAYVKVRDIVDRLEFQSEWDDESKSFKIGDTDVLYEIRPDSRNVLKEGQEMSMQDPALLHEGATYIPLTAVTEIFQEDGSFTVINNTIQFTPILSNLQELYDEGQTDEQLDFADDPNQPAEEELDAVEDTEDTAVWDDLKDGALPAAINKTRVVSTAKKYLGVKYKFGAGSFPSTNRFDCSTYTQYVYDKYRVNLPRVARKQATRGSTISRKNLRKGDLLFFYVPGRFKSNKTVGHVGIYAGNGTMIHASPQPKNGVQLSNINSSYWKKTFIKAKRVS